MPHEFLEYESHSTEGLLLSADLLNDYRLAEEAANEKESKKSPKARAGSARNRKLKGQHPNRMKNLPKKK